MKMSNSKSKSSALTKKGETPNALATSTDVANISLDTNLLTMANQNDFSYILKETGNRLLVVEFFAQWCGPCQTLSTKLEGLANSYNGRILIVRVDVDEFEDLTLEYNISAIPTFMFMKNQKKVDQFSSSNITKLEESLEKYAGKPAAEKEKEKIKKSQDTEKKE